MQIILDNSNSKHHLTHYKVGQFTVDGQILTHSILINKDVCKLWAPQSFSELKAADLNAIVDLEPEVILLGTGEKQIFAKGELYQAIINLKIAVEIMDTAAACRTLQVLQAENRRVSAALIVR